MCEGLHIALALAVQDDQEYAEGRKNVFAKHRFQSEPISAYPDRKTWGKDKQSQQGMEALMQIAGGPAAPVRRRPPKPKPELSDGGN